MHETGRQHKAARENEGLAGERTGTEALLNKPYWVIDILPEQVPENSAGQYFAIEKYYLQQSGITDIHRRFTDIILKLNCYSAFLVWLPDQDQQIRNPEPEKLVSWINAEQKDLCIVLAGEDVLITLNHDDTYMTVYNPPEALINRLRSLALAHGLFLWQPHQEDSNPE